MLTPEYLLKPLDELTWDDLPTDQEGRGRAIVDLALRQMPYEEYLRTDHWMRVRHLAMQEKPEGKCVCGDRATEAHHLTYERIGCEQQGDVIGLCKPCHHRFHLTWCLRIRYELEKALQECRYQEMRQLIKGA